MSKSLIDDHLWALMTEDQKVGAVLAGQATLHQMSEGLLDGSEQLRNACREFLSGTDPTFENLAVDSEQPDGAPQPSDSAPAQTSKPRAKSESKIPSRAHSSKHRFGLPDDFEPRPKRYGRSVLLEFNIYRLPTGQEYIASRPTGTLGTTSHLYALLTCDQYLNGRRGSVYVRNDGRIFDYSVDTLIPLGDLFDTGYTIADLERTGRYASDLRKKKRRRAARVRAAAAG